MLIVFISLVQQSTTKLGGLKQRNFLSHSSGGSKSSQGARGVASALGLSGILFHAFPLGVSGTGNPGWE